MSDAPETRMNRGGDFSNIYKRDHFVESVKATRGVAAAAEERHLSHNWPFRIRAPGLKNGV